MSMSPVVGRLAPIITRHCLTSIAASPDWDTKFEMDHFLPCRRSNFGGKISLLSTLNKFSSQSIFRVFYSTMIREYYYFRGDDTCRHGRGKDSFTCF